MTNEQVDRDLHKIPERLKNRPGRIQLYAIRPTGTLRVFMAGRTYQTALPGTDPAPPAADVHSPEAAMVESLIHRHLQVELQPESIPSQLRQAFVARLRQINVADAERFQQIWFPYRGKRSDARPLDLAGSGITREADAANHPRDWVHAERQKKPGVIGHILAAPAATDHNFAFWEADRREVRTTTLNPKSMDMPHAERTLMVAGHGSAATPMNGPQVGGAHVDYSAVLAAKLVRDSHAAGTPIESVFLNSCSQADKTPIVDQTLEISTSGGEEFAATFYAALPKGLRVSVYTVRDSGLVTIGSDGSISTTGGKQSGPSRAVKQAVSAEMARRAEWKAALTNVEAMLDVGHPGWESVSMAELLRLSGEYQRLAKVVEQNETITIGRWATAFALARMADVQSTQYAEQVEKSAPAGIAERLAVLKSELHQHDMHKRRADATVNKSNHPTQRSSR